MQEETWVRSDTRGLGGMEGEAGGLESVSIVVCGCVLLFIFHSQLVHIGSHLPFMTFLMSPKRSTRSLLRTPVPSSMRQH